MVNRIFLFLAFVLLSAPVQTQAQKKVVGYYPSWLKGSYSHTVIQYKDLTHIAHAFIFPYADGTLDYSSFSLYPELNSAAHLNGVQVIICVGGWDEVRTPRFAQMAADSAARKKFVGNLVQFIQTNNYDGADLDWEYPKNAADRTNLKNLVHELRIAFNAADPSYSLSMAGPSTGWSAQWFDLESMKNDFDWIGIMTYDYYGAWTAKAGPNSALYGSFSRNTEGWIDYSYGYYNTTRGVPKEKLLIGIPFYGQVFNASAMYGVSTGGSQQTYTAIMPKLQQNWTRYWDAEGQVPYLINSTASQVISYDDSQSVALKCAYINAKGSGGAIIWAIGQDQFQAKTPLLTIIGANILSPLIVGEENPAALPVSSNLFQNYPNPFNGNTVIRFSVGRRGFISIMMFDMLGREVKRLAEGVFEPGNYEIPVSSEDLTSGVYLYRLTNDGIIFTRSMIVLR